MASMSMTRVSSEPGQRIISPIHLKGRAQFTPRGSKSPSDQQQQPLKRVEEGVDHVQLMRDIRAEDGERAKYSAVRGFMEHDFSNSLCRFPIEPDVVRFRARFNKPPLSAPEDREWQVYPEDLSTGKNPHAWGAPLIEDESESEEDEDEERKERRRKERKKKEIEVDVGGELVRLLRFNLGFKTWDKALEQQVPWECLFPGVVFHPDCEQEMQLHFHYNRTVGEYLTSTKTSLPISIPHVAKSLQTFLGPSVARIVPLQMWITSESAHNLPSDIDVQLISKQRDEKGGVVLKPWFFHSGPNPSAEPHPDCPVLSHWVPRGTHSSSASTPTFWCDSKVTKAEFARWATTNFDAVENMLESPECNHEDKPRFIKRVDKKGHTPENVLQFLCLTEWHRIVHQSELRGTDGAVQPSFSDYDASKDKSNPDMKSTFKVDPQVMMKLIQEKRDTVDKHNNIMDLFSTNPADTHSSLSLQLRQVHHSFPTLPLQEKDPVSYHCTVHIRFCCLD